MGVDEAQAGGGLREPRQTGSHRGRLGMLGATGLLVVAATIFALTRGGGGESEQLRALKADPMGKYVPLRGRLVESHGRSERETGTLAKAQPASYHRLFSLQPADAQAALRASLGAARTAGWELREAPDGRSAVGEKRLPTGPGILTIVLTEDARLLPEGVGAPALSIALEHVQV
jgi:hypothetical protein